MIDIKEHILMLEDTLLHSDFQENPEKLNDLISEDFQEIGSIGKIASREEVFHWLINKDKAIEWSLIEFSVKEIAPDIVLANYIANKKDVQKDISKGTIRSSLWKLIDDKWKMIFHQATKIL